MELLRFRWRIVLWLLVASLGCAASSEQFVGLWRNTNEERFAEIELRRDGSSTSFSRNNAIIAVVPLQEQFGTWQIDGELLTLYATDRYSRKRSRKRLRLAEVANNTMRIRVGGHSDTYRRIHLPTCSEPAAEVKHAIRAESLIGTWRCHYRTHDYEYSFQRGHRVTISASDPPDRPHKMYTGIWSIRGTTLTMKPPRDSFNTPDEKAVWNIIRVSKQCLVFRDGSSMSYVLQRLR